MKPYLACLWLAALLTACSPPAPLTATPVATPTLSQAPSLTTTGTSEATLTPDLRLPPERWQEWPVIPQWISPRMLEIYRLGQELGNDPHSFSKIGDGEISTAWFLISYDSEPSFFELGPYPELQPVIDMYSGSFGRSSKAARRGFTTQMILDPAYVSLPDCSVEESPLDCELRLNHPSIAMISLGTNQVWAPQDFESGLRGIIERLLEKGVVPILSTKADNLEGDQGINRIIANLAAEYELPLWNFWRAVQPLPNHGLQQDLEHLTYFGDAYNFSGDLQDAWSWRNLTALQTLAAVSRGVGIQP
jgi:hypothetical protein